MSRPMNMTTKHTVLIMAGGTGGHVVPALSVAQVLKSHGVQVEWLGTKAGIESRLVPAANIPIHWLNISGLRGKSAVTLLLAPFRLLSAIWQALRAIRKINPDAVLGMGGFASGPGGVAARLLGKRLVIHEQNAIAGMTNRYLARMADVVAYAFEGAFESTPRKAEKYHRIGNPVRPEIEHLSISRERSERRLSDAINVLVLGGSLGAAALNDALPLALLKSQEVSRLRIRHQAGSRNIDAAKAAYEALTDAVRTQVDVKDFIDDMAAAYRWADLVICRSGALTVAEVAAAGVASVLVPYPHAVDDHQTLNAEVLQRVGAGLICQQSDLTPELLAGLLDQFAADSDRLIVMGEAARSLAEFNTAERLAALCLPNLADSIHPKGAQQ